MASLKDRLKEILIRDNVVSSQELEQALSEQQASGVDLGKVLLKQKLIEEDVLLSLFSELLSVPLLDIRRLKISQKVLSVVSKEFSEKYHIFPLSIIGDRLSVATSYPLDVFATDDIKEFTGYTINLVFVREKDLLAAITKYYADDAFKESEPQESEGESENETLDDIIKDIRDTEDLELIKDLHGDDTKTSIENLSDDAPIIKLTDTIIHQAVVAKASDVFIEPLEKSVRIRYRVDGVIREIDKMAKALHFPIISRIKVISNLDISEHRLPQDGRFKTMLSGDRSVDFRVSVLPTVFGEKICLRVLDQTAKVLDVDSLGFEAGSLERLKEAAIKPHGMILACGPTGSGKTTTLYSILSYVDSPEKNIVTVEDPVEYQMKGINQVNIKTALGLTFPASLRSILRQDPDVIMIGEIRDSETMDIAVKAALTGHLVLSSLHTTTAAGSIVRMVNMGVQPFLICSSVLAIIAQRLIRRVCPKCKEAYQLDQDVALKVGYKQDAIDAGIELFRGKGCKDCFHSGYKGRVGITEILTFTPNIKELILARKSESIIKQAARAEGMFTMREDGLAKARNGLTTLEEVLRITASDTTY